MFKTRAISAVFLVLILGTVLWFGGIVLALFLLGISLIAFFELLRVMGIYVKGNKPSALEICGYISVVALYVLVYLPTNSDFTVVWLVMTFIVLLGVYVLSFPRYDAKQVFGTFFSIVYAPLMLSFIYRIREMEQGLIIVLLVFIASWISDTFAYITGMLLGKHKLAPKLSPKKSIEGSVGGIVGAALVGALYGFLFFGGAEMILGCALIGGVGSVVSQIGDLAASGVKRNFDIKDYGNLIPGHGGIMDRFDSVLVTAPMIYFLALLLLV